MLLIRCPYCCEERSEEEFTCAGEGGIRRPASPSDLSDAEWADYLHFRTNPKGLHREIWCHTAGCGRYFEVVRHTVTYAIHSTAPIGAKAAADEANG
ncbi:MAG: sarcosine oxidase subunit delta [Gammaproteobacteria bacterium]|nr:sarcosine oxidase subunit delta [Gammaproteobacteria bacterium]